MKLTQVLMLISLLVIIYFLVISKIKERFSTLISTSAANKMFEIENRRCEPLAKALGSAINDVPLVQNMRIMNTKQQVGTGQQSEEENTCYMKASDTIINGQCLTSENDPHPNLFHSKFAHVIESIEPGTITDPDNSNNVETKICKIKFKKDAPENSLIDYAVYVNNQDPNYQQILSDNIHVKKENKRLDTQLNDTTNRLSQKSAEHDILYASNQDFKRNIDSLSGTNSQLSSTVSDLTNKLSNVKGINESPEDFQKWFSYQGAGIDQGGVVWTKGCNGPWAGVYKIGCEANNTTVWSDELGPVTHWYWQGPHIRIGPNGWTKCARHGGLVRVKRSRPQQKWEDITDKVKSWGDNSKPFDRKTSIFYDNYKMDC
jgi:hypothetical protein